MRYNCEDVAVADKDRRQVLRAVGAISICATFESLVNRVGAQEVKASSQEGVFDLGSFRLESGTVLRGAKIVYKTHGTLNPDKSNAILYPTQIGAQHGDVEWPIGPGNALDPNTHFIVLLDQLGNGLSSSPCNCPPPFDRGRFPAIGIRDDVAAQHRLVTERFGIRRVALVVGYSMGAQQSYQWAVSHPDMVERIAPFCGTAKTTPHNIVFLQSLRAALAADGAWSNGNDEQQPTSGMRALARVYAAWGLSQQFYRQELWRQMGFDTLEGFVMGFWEKRYGRRDANNMLSMIKTWEPNDVGATPGCGTVGRLVAGAVGRSAAGRDPIRPGSWTSGA
jgi:homoserine O-acetyltransferase